MMGKGLENPIRECHSFQVAGQSVNAGADNKRLPGLVEIAAEHWTNGVVAVDANSGYYSGEGGAQFLNRGIDTCTPDSTPIATRPATCIEVSLLGDSPEVARHGLLRI